MATNPVPPLAPDAPENHVVADMYTSNEDKPATRHPRSLKRAKTASVHATEQFHGVGGVYDTHCASLEEAKAEKAQKVLQNRRYSGKSVPADVGRGLDQQMRVAALSPQHGHKYTSYPAEHWTHRSVNPHVDQVFLNGEISLSSPQLHRSDLSFQRVLNPGCPHLPYRRRSHDAKTCLHWGQRKLLLSEIEFLTLYGDTSSKVVVYAGAAPGTHILYLSQLFPELTFHLWDPNWFNVHPTPRVHLFQKYFTTEVAHRYAGQGVLFISDVRTANSSTMSAEEVEERVWYDMEQQQSWHLAMRSHRSMLKFRLPWEDRKVTYLDGHVFLPIFGPQTTTEARLVPFGDQTKEWDSQKYMEQMFYFNTVLRNRVYNHALKGEASEGLDHCYDCTCEVFVLNAYLAERERLASRGGEEKEEEQVQVPGSVEDSDTQRASGSASSSSSSSSSSGAPSATRLVSNAHIGRMPPYTREQHEERMSISTARRASIVEMSRQMSRQLGKRTLVDPQPLPGHRRFEQRVTPLELTVQQHAPMQHLTTGNDKRSRECDS